MMLETFKVYPRARTEEARLYRLARSGDRTAFGELVQSVDAILFGVMFQLFGDGGKARQAYRAAVGGAYDDRNQWPPDVSFAIWLIRLGLRGATTRSRAVRREQRIREEDRYAVPEDERRRGRLAPLAEPRNLRVTTAVGRGLEQLPERTRALTYLRIHAGYTVETLAVILESIPVSVSVSLFQATEMVRRFRTLSDQATSARVCIQEHPSDDSAPSSLTEPVPGFGVGGSHCMRAREHRALVQDGDLELEALSRYREHLRNCQMCLEYAVHLADLEQNLRGLYREEAATHGTLRSLTETALAEPERRGWFKHRTRASK